LLANVRRHREVRARIVTVLVSGAVAVYAAEGFLFWDPLELRGPRPREGFDLRGPLEVVRDLRASGTAAYPVLATATWLESPVLVDDTPVIPLSGIPHATTVMCNETGAYVIYESDRFGFNAPDGQWDLHPEVALVGDSLVDGWCVPREESMAGFVRRAIPTTLNVGYAGHGPLAQLGTIREYVAPRRPAHVFWFFYEGNDLKADLPRERRSLILRRYLEPRFSQELQQRAVGLGKAMRRRFDARLAIWAPSLPAGPAHQLVAFAKLELLRELRGNLFRPGSRSQPSSLVEFRRIVAEAKRSVEEWGGSLHLVYLPDLPSVISDGNPPDHRRVIALAADLGLGTVDLLSDFKNHPSPLSLFPYTEGGHLVRTRGLHYNREGHRLVARRVLDVILKYRKGSVSETIHERGRDAGSQSRRSNSLSPLPKLASGDEAARGREPLRATNAVFRLRPERRVLLRRNRANSEPSWDAASVGYAEGGVMTDQQDKPPDHPPSQVIHMPAGKIVFSAPQIGRVVEGPDSPTGRTVDRCHHRAGSRFRPRTALGMSEQNCLGRSTLAGQPRTRLSKRSCKRCGRAGKRLNVCDAQQSEISTGPACLKRSP
jgi:hypothetical protein